MSATPLTQFDLDQMSADEVEFLLRMRLRAFVSRGHDWQQALMLAVTPEATEGVIYRCVLHLEGAQARRTIRWTFAHPIAESHVGAGVAYCTPLE
jgi:hypothetical protein